MHNYGRLGSGIRSSREKRSPRHFDDQRPLSVCHVERSAIVRRTMQRSRNIPITHPRPTRFPTRSRFIKPIDRALLLKANHSPVSKIGIQRDDYPKQWVEPRNLVVRRADIRYGTRGCKVFQVDKNIEDKENHRAMMFPCVRLVRAQRPSADLNCDERPQGELE